MGDEARPGGTRREFLRLAGTAGVVWGMSRGSAGGAAEPDRPPVDAGGKVIPGFEPAKAESSSARPWQPFSDRKLRVGIAGYGLCQFGAAFGFQNHPNVEVVAVADLIAARCAALAKACRCEKTYPSCEEMIKDDRIEAVFVATDAPSHARLAIAALEKGKHVASAVPAVFGSLDDADRLFEAVKKNRGLKYMMFETSCFHAELYTWRRQYLAGELGKLIYAEGEYYHYFGSPLAGYNPTTKNVDTDGWRKGLPPQWYPTHSNAYYIGITGGSFTEVSCMGMPSIVPHLQAENNAYKNPFGSEIALFRTSEGGMARMAVCWDMPAAGGEQGRVYGQRQAKAAKIERPPLPPGVDAGGHGGSHGYLMCDFVEAVLRDRQPAVDAAQALNMTVAGIVAHQSALKNGELMKVPQYVL